MWPQSTTTARPPPPRRAGPSSRSGRARWPRRRSSRHSLADLEAAVGTADRVVVAFSGGVDSSLVAAVSHRVLGGNAVAVTAVSPALATGELEGAREVARAIGIEHRAVSTHELARDGYRRNGPDRCYHCKS